jgi:hypothetical protein
VREVVLEVMGVRKENKHGKGCQIWKRFRITVETKNIHKNRANA